MSVALLLQDPPAAVDPRPPWDMQAVKDAALVVSYAETRIQEGPVVRRVSWKLKEFTPGQ